jgi:L-alanine-DL-glutamate epimerase-like enolase superfamily enzyme
MGIGPIDIALWDFAGKHYDAPIHELLGTYRRPMPAYASTYHGDENGGLDSPAAVADVAEECLGMGYGGFKIHGWGGGDARRDLDREIAAVHAVGEAVGSEMDLMHDPACELETFADALQLGRALDEEGFYWYEDPFRDGGISGHAHRNLREKLDTPILQTEHVRELELESDFVAGESTDFLRADPEYDGGITGAMKIAHVAEGFGIDVEFHAPGPAQRHCIAATRNTNYYELALVHPEAAHATAGVRGRLLRHDRHRRRRRTGARPRGTGPRRRVRLGLRRGERDGEDTRLRGVTPAAVRGVVTGGMWGAGVPTPE